ncbi:MAG TPA: RlpA-like double-psi beta-barrel domain-containing protein [Chthoniobacterales bacterium]|nr:RlpA-like double-psi beta-barrel domain-containing protein [Chthoniobacterales bacterium]
MPAPRNELAQRGLLQIRLPRLITTRRIAGGLLAATTLICSDCKRPASQARREHAEEKPAASALASSPKAEPEKKAVEREVHAVWYDVPAESLAKRRAGNGELTAAHNHLPLGTLVRVTHVANGKSVIVRITDRGITSRHATIDLCKEAAEKLDILREGSALVRLEVLPDDKGAAAKTDSPAPALPP